MSFDLFKTGVPCAICATRIDSWEGEETARPCGHTLDQIVMEATVFEFTVPRVRFGQHADEGATT